MLSAEEEKAQKQALSLSFYSTEQEYKETFPVLAGVNRKSGWLTTNSKQNHWKIGRRQRYRPPVLTIGALGGSQNNYTDKEKTGIQNQTSHAIHVCSQTAGS